MLNTKRKQSIDNITSTSFYFWNIPKFHFRSLSEFGGPVPSRLLFGQSFLTLLHLNRRINVQYNGFVISLENGEMFLLAVLCKSNTF